MSYLAASVIWLSGFGCGVVFCVVMRIRKRKGEMA